MNTDMFANPDVVPEFVPRYRVKDSDMPDDLKHFAAALTAHAVDNQMSIQEISAHVKSLMNEKLTGTWQCILGTNFAHSITYVHGNYNFFYIGQLAVLIYKSPAVLTAAHSEAK